MKEKIRHYVEYHFRFKEGKEKEELVEEVTSNLIDRFETLKEKYGDEQKAYREAIGHMGDFSEVETDDRIEYTLRPKLYDVGLVVALTLAIFGLVSVIMQGNLAFVLTVASIVVFVASAYHSYHNALYEKNVNGDMDYFYLYLDKSFSYLKPAFIFWAITFSVLLGQTIAGMVLFMVGAGDPLNAIQNIEGIEGFIGIYVFGFLIATPIIGVLFYFVYMRIMDHYRYISGKDHLKGSLAKGMGMLRFEKSPDIDWKRVTRTIAPWFMLLIYFVSLLSPMALERDYGSRVTYQPLVGMIFSLMSPEFYFTGLILLLGYGLGFTALIQTIRKRSASFKWVIITTIGLIASLLLVTILLNVVNESTYLSFLTPFSLIALVFGGVVISALQIGYTFNHKNPKGRD